MIAYVTRNKEEANIRKKKRDLRIKSGYLWEVGVERVKGRIIYHAVSMLYSIKKSVEITSWIPSWLRR